MTDLTEQWKKGELIEEKKYYCISKNIADILKAECHNKGQNDEWWTLKNGKYCFNNVYHKNDIKVLAPVPTYEEWQASENYIDYLKQCISVYESKDKQATETSIAYNELLDENTKLKELLKRVNEHFKWVDHDDPFYVNDELWDDIKKALGEYL